MSIDWAILHGIHSALTCGFLDFLMPKISLLGDVGAVWLLASFGLLCSRKYRRYGFFLLAGLALGFLAGNVVLKNLIARPRPCWLEPGVQLLVAVPADCSFPSGHSLASAVGATVLTMADRRFGWAAVPLAVLIAFSRLYLYVHFPSDVLGGLALGALLGWGMCRLGQKLWARMELRRNAGRARGPAE